MLWGPPRALQSVLLLVAAACLPDAQAPPHWSDDLINWLKYYVPQLGDPNLNPSSLRSHPRAYVYVKPKRYFIRYMEYNKTKAPDPSP